jgi:hypothetical protein
MNLEGGRILREPFTHIIAPNLGLRIYPDRRPGNLEIAGIHKALVLVRGGKEIIEEGAGFGLPVVKYKDKTYFPGSAILTLLKSEPPPIVVKSYLLDTISIKSLGRSRISDTFYQPIHTTFARFYLSLGKLRPIFDTLIKLRDTVGLRTNFEATTPRGKVDIIYTLYPDYVEISVSPYLDQDFKELILLNEQGASTFRRYIDSSKQFIDRQMGAWDRIDFNEATLSDLNGGLSFTVERPNGAGFWRGRESVRGKLSWAGLALSFKNTEKIKYTIRIKSNDRDPEKTH